LESFLEILVIYGGDEKSEAKSLKSFFEKSAREKCRVFAEEL